MNLDEERIRELQRKDQEHDARLDMQKEKDDEHDVRIDALYSKEREQDFRLKAQVAKDAEHDFRLNSVDSVNKMQFTYIPKAQLANSDKYKKYISDGDIIGIVTNKQGLDISHVGFAVWHDDGLHLMHASSLKKEVIEDPLTLYQYLQRQKTGVGIRVANVK